MGSRKNDTVSSLLSRYDHMQRDAENEFIREISQMAPADMGGSAFRSKVRDFLSSTRPRYGNNPDMVRRDAKLEDDALMKLLRSGSADADAQNDAANWIAKLYGEPQVEMSAPTKL